MINIKSVIGSNYGDEGKGYMTDYFAYELSKNGKVLVVCNNGGSQKGHTVETKDGKRFIFHHFGSGVFAKADTYLAQSFILNPMTFMIDYQSLKKLTTLTKTYINETCRFSTPFDMLLNQILEESRKNNRYGSCGVGIWETVVRYKEMQNLLSIKEASELSEEELFQYIKYCQHYSYKRLTEIYNIELSDSNWTKEWKLIWESDALILNYIQDFQEMMKVIKLTSTNILDNYTNIVFENSQGLLLDQNQTKYINNTTPSNTGLKAVFEVLDEWKNKDEIQLEVCYVTRSYITKHGAGDFIYQCEKDEINKDMVDETNIPNPYQGILRYGKLNLQDLFNTINEDYKEKNKHKKIDIKKSIAITHLNEYPLNKYDCHYYDIVQHFDEYYLSYGRTREFI